MKQTIFLEPDKVYHIYNRANGSELMFRDDDDYLRFLQRFGILLGGYLDTLAYCLLPNHFHLMVRIVSTLEVDEEREEVNLHQLFSNLFNGYTKYFNLKYERKGSLFMPNFKRKEVYDSHYFAKLIAYIHTNPVKHGLVDDLNEWTFSSYHAYTTLKSSRVNTKDMIDFFGSKEELIRFHQNYNELLHDMKGLDMEG